MPDATLLLVILLGALCQGATGIGFGLVTMAVLPQFLDVQIAVPLVAGLALLACTVVLIRWRKHVKLTEVTPLLLGEVVGTPLGVFFLVTLDRRIVTGLLGAVLVVYGLSSLVRNGDAARGPRTSLGRGWGVLAGLLGGMLGGAFNTGGPPLVVYGAARGWSPGAFRANLQAVFLFNCVLQVSLLGASGLLSRDIARLQLLALPALLLGLGLGTWLGGKMDAARFRRVIFALLVAFGAVYVARSLTG